RDPSGTVVVQAGEDRVAGRGVEPAVVDRQRAGDLDHAARRHGQSFTLDGKQAITAGHQVTESVRRVAVARIDPGQVGGDGPVHGDGVHAVLRSGVGADRREVEGAAIQEDRRVAGAGAGSIERVLVGAGGDRVVCQGGCGRVVLGDGAAT